MARSRDLFSFKRNFLRLLFTVVLPSAALSGFGVLAIKNERAAMEKNLEVGYASQLNRLEQALAQRIDQPLARLAPLFGAHPPAEAARRLHDEDPLVGPVTVLGPGLAPIYVEAPLPQGLLSRPLPERTGEVAEVDFDGQLYAMARTARGLVVYRLELPVLVEKIFPALVAERLPGETAQIKLEPVAAPPPPKAQGLPGLMADVVAAEQQAAAVFAPDARDSTLLNLLRLQAREFFRRPRRASGAESGDRADETLRIRARAQGRAEFHHRLVVFARVAPNDERVGERREMLHCLHAILEEPRFPRQSRQDADDIAVHDSDRFGEGNAGDGRGGVRPDARQLTPFGRRARRLGRGDVGLREFVEIAGAGVVAEAFPEFQHLRLGRRGKRGEVGQFAQPAVEVG